MIEVTSMIEVTRPTHLATLAMRQKNKDGEYEYCALGHMAKETGAKFGILYDDGTLDKDAVAMEGLARRLGIPTVEQYEFMDANDDALTMEDRIKNFDQLAEACENVKMVEDKT